MQPLVESNYLQLVSGLRDRLAAARSEADNLGEFRSDGVKQIQQKLSHWRERYLQRFVADESFWLSWIEDQLLEAKDPAEGGSSSDDHEQRQCLALCDRAVSECPTHALCMVYVQIAQKMQEDEQLVSIEFYYAQHHLFIIADHTEKCVA